MISTYGIVSTHSLSISFPNYLQNQFLDLFEKYSVNGELDIKDWDNLEDLEKTMFLTDRHEFDHFYQLISSSFGISLFRIFNVLSGDVSWISKEFNNLGLNISNVGQNLIDWLYEKGLHDFKSRSSLIHRGLDKAAYLEYEVIPGIESLMKLISLKTAKKLPNEFVDLTVDQLCDILNCSSAYLRRRSDINIINNLEDTGFRWESRQKGNTKVFKDGYPFFSFSNLLEVLAYLDEFRFIKRNNSNEKNIKDWSIQRVPKSYRKLFELVLDNFSDPSTARGFISSYLDSRIDITCGKQNPKNQEVFYIEDELPFFMLDLDTEDRYKKTINSIEGYNCIIERGQLFGEDSNWRNLSTNIEVNHLEFNSHLLKIESNFLKGIKRKRDVLQEQIKGNLTTIKLDDLIFSIEYKDHIKVWGENIEMSKPGGITSLINQLCSSMLHPIIPSVALKIIEGKPVFISDQKVEKIINTLKYHIEEHVGSKIIDDLRSTIQKLFDREMIIQGFPGADIKWFRPLK